jgi:hypothetical protein
MPTSVTIIHAFIALGIPALGILAGWLMAWDCDRAGRD